MEGHEGASFGKKCRKCQLDIAGKHVAVHGFNVTRWFHPNCFQCVECKKVIQPGEKYTVEKEGSKCGDCFSTWQAQVSKSPRGGVKSKPSEARGVVWQMCQAIEAANPAVETKGPPKKDQEAVRNGNMGTCDACRAPIFGVLIQVGDRNLHDKCHCCKRCGRQFADGETFVRDNSKHTVCDACVTAEHEKKVTAKPPMQNEIQELEKKSMGNCGACSKAIISTQCATFQNVLFHRSATRHALVV